MTPSDLNGATDKKLARIVSEAESHLAAQLQSGIAADQRAMSFVSLMAAATVVVAGGGAAAILTTPPQILLGWACLLIAIGFLGSMFCAVRSALPTDFYFPGSLPEDWLDNVQAGTDYEDSLREQTANINDNINDNHDCLTLNGWWMKTAVWIAFGSLGVGGSIAIIALGYVTFRLLSAP